MKRLLRIFGYSLLTFSLLISIASVLAWHRTLSCWDFVSIHARRTNIIIDTYPDELEVLYGRRYEGPPREWNVKYLPYKHPPAPTSITAIAGAFAGSISITSNGSPPASPPPA